MSNSKKRLSTTFIETAKEFKTQYDKYQNDVTVLNGTVIYANFKSGNITYRDQGDDHLSSHQLSKRRA